ncbi:MAG: tryptophan synthase subunit alpha [Chloroflexota bacterium]|nr:MAG: tryptophan synthase subunit alpha [Chloroflexota bacterium]
MLSNRLDESFVRARREGRGVLIPYLTAGYPRVESFVDLAVAILEAGADALEIGIPFSDPLLDGPSIQRSQQQALDQGVTPGDCLQFAAELRNRSDKPLLFMGAYNPLLAHGLGAFCGAASSSGITALIVPDLPVEEQIELRNVCGAHGLHVIQLVAPTSTDDRLSRVCSLASGFVYCISITGVTGARSSVTATARPLVERVRACTTIPVAVGFGIAEPDQARAVAEFADGVIVGSALINTIANASPDDCIDAVQTFIGGLRRGLEHLPVGR